MSEQGEQCPKRTDIKKILIIGSGPIIIGQACEFDYSGAQACKALRAEGYEVVLVNSNPATIMTDPELAQRTYIEPLTKEYLEEIIIKERPDALLPTVGGQTALNLAVELAESGILEKHKSRDDWRDAARDQSCRRSPVVQGCMSQNRTRSSRLRTGQQCPGRAAALRSARISTGHSPLVHGWAARAASIAYNKEEFADAISHALDMSPVHEALVEESVLGWKEYELEVMRDYRDNSW